MRGCNPLVIRYLLACETLLGPVDRLLGAVRGRRTKGEYLLAPRVFWVLVEETRNYNNA